MPILLNILVAMLMGAPTADDVDAQARRIEGNLIAPCCWSQPVSQHYSETAEQIKSEVRHMLTQGYTEQQIYDHYVSLYGERILASPRAKGFNLLVWVLPWVSLGLGTFILVMLLRKWRQRNQVLQPEASGRDIDEKYAARMERELRDME